MELLGPWRIIFVVFVTYSMLPLSLRWCLFCGTISSVAHTIIVVSFTPVSERTFDFAKKHLQPTVIFQQDGGPPRWGIDVRAFLDTTFPNRWNDAMAQLPGHQDLQTSLTGFLLLGLHQRQSLLM
ncbi:hypothetical protein AVEN_82177-1 [Araneus ventricosus]|uniref:Uncharacterized protein n=1 Tax=Araneus ventricosus TaxID=182803 RepID=A0A4Y2IVI7_ARAVE|nr:hypothetical protein AVEN_82177-1 [Araneus ventricosus]